MAPLRRIWLCADDYGIAPGVNGAIRDLLARGRLNATSVMVGSPHFDAVQASALDAVVAGGRGATGLHFTLTGPFRPLSHGFAPLAGDAFPSIKTMMLRSVFRLLDARALAAEAAAQISAFVATFGRPPDFVDGHQHVHLFPQVRDAIIAAVKTQAPRAWMRQCGSVNGTPRLSDPKAMILDAFSRGFVRAARTAGVALNPAFAGTYSFRDDADFPALFPGFLSGLPTGSVVMCHPGVVDAELKRLDPLTTLREHEYSYLGGATFPRDLAAAGLTLA